MKSFVLYTLCAIVCAACSVIVDEVFLSGVYAICTVGWGVISGMTLQDLLNKDK